MLKRISFLLLFFVHFQLSQAQQDPLFSTYQFNRVWHNPGYAGAENKKVFTLISRNQWQVSQNPMTFMLTYDQPFKKDSKSGIGGNVTYDHLGNLTTIQAGFIYSYKIEFGDKANLRIGTQVGMHHVKVDGGNFTVINPNDPIYNSLSQGGEDTKFDINLGAWLTVSKFYAGASTTHLLEPNLRDINYKLARHHYFITGLDLDLGSELKLLPSIGCRLLESKAIRGVTDISSLLQYKNKYLFGGSYRFSINYIYNTNPLVIYTGINISEKVQIILTYDAPITNLGYAVEGNIKVRL